MRPEVLEAYVSSFIAASPGPLVHFGWHRGGRTRDQGADEPDREPSQHHKALHPSPPGTSHRVSAFLAVSRPRPPLSPLLFSGKDGDEGWKRPLRRTKCWSGVVLVGWWGYRLSFTTLAPPRGAFGSLGALDSLPGVVQLSTPTPRSGTSGRAPGVG